MDDKRSIDVTANSLEDLKQALSKIPGWEVGEGSTHDFEIGLWRGQNEFINFKVEPTDRGVKAHSVNIIPQDLSEAPRLRDDEIYKVYTFLFNLPSSQEIGVSMNLSEQDIDKQSKE